ncbi:MAG: histidinol-phosphate transaminase [Firmicutes bacterium]|nr:histidinol-phosphate transaminase [Alicyclobacillaceae bacterium]MCL6496582.1 histidinol-phosphate transaminase [Bacillota bacterium]
MVRVRKTVASLAPYQPGRSLETVARERGTVDAIKLASNESLWGPSPRARAAAMRALEQCHLYPEVRWEPLQRALADLVGTVPEAILVGNGADELLRVLATALLEPGDEALVLSPSFSYYRTAVLLAHGTPVAVPLTEDGAPDLEQVLAHLTPRTRLVYLCSPNNPTGNILRQPTWQTFLDRLPDHVLVVVDQAYVEFATDPALPNLVRDIAAGRPVAMVRTLSKAYGLAGLRIGWMMADPALIRQLERVRDPFAVNVVALYAALAAIEDQEWLKMVVGETVTARVRVAAALAHRGLAFYPSQANFLTFAVPVAAEVAADRLEAYGVIVRPAHSFGLDRHLRVTLGPEWAMRRFLDALDRVLAELDHGPFCR